MTAFPLNSETNFTYAEVGVDVDVEAKAARILYEAARETWSNRAGTLGEVVVPDDNFSGLRFVRVSQLPEGTVMYGGSDGVATKTEIAERAGKVDTLGLDLMAMVCDDAAIKGAEPILVKSVLAVNTLGRNEDRLKYIREIAVGYVAGAREAGVAVINGEFAQHNDRMGPPEVFHLDWSGDVTWFAHESRLITGLEVRAGDYLIGLREEGPRSNGISLIRRALQRLHGENWDHTSIDGQRVIDLALRPSRIYSKAIVDMTGGWDLNRSPKAKLHGAAHITGGGIPEKLGRTLRPSGLGAVIDDAFAPSDLMIRCQLAGVNDYEAYRTWNMGQGMILIAPSYENVIRVAHDHSIEAKVIGQVTQQPGITIYSRGIEGKILRF